MARTFNPGTLRYAVAFALSTGKDLSCEELVAAAHASNEKATKGNVKSALNGLSAAGLAEYDHDTSNWCLTLAGLADRLPRGQHRVRFSKLPDDLLGTMLLAFH